MPPRDSSGVWRRGPRMTFFRETRRSIALTRGGRCGPMTTPKIMPFEFIDAGGCTHYRYMNQLQTIPLYGPGGVQYWHKELPAVSWVCTCSTCVESIQKLVETIHASYGVGANISGYGPVFEQLMTKAYDKGQITQNANGTFELSFSSGYEIGVDTSSENEEVDKVEPPYDTATEKMQICDVIQEEIEAMEDAIMAAQVDTSGVSSADEAELCFSGEKSASPELAPAPENEGNEQVYDAAASGSDKVSRYFSARPKTKGGRGGSGDAQISTDATSTSGQGSVPPFKGKNYWKSLKNQERRSAAAAAAAVAASASAAADANIEARKGNKVGQGGKDRYCSFYRRNTVQHYYHRYGRGSGYGSSPPYPFYDLFWAFYWMSVMGYGNFALYNHNNSVPSNGWNISASPGLLVAAAAAAASNLSARSLYK